MSFATTFLIVLLFLMVVGLTVALVIVLVKRSSKVCLGLDVKRPKNDDVLKVMEILGNIVKVAHSEFVCANKDDILAIINEAPIDDTVCESVENLAGEGTPASLLVREIQKLQGIVCDGDQINVKIFREIMTAFVENSCG